MQRRELLKFLAISLLIPQKARSLPNLAKIHGNNPMGRQLSRL